MTTVTLLQLKSDFFNYIGERWTGTTGPAAGGDTHKLTDTTLIGYQSETWPTKFEGQQLRITGGIASGDLRIITRADRSNGDLYVNRAFSGTLSAGGDAYEIWGTSINGASPGPLTSIFQDIFRAIRPVTDTQLTIVTRQLMYDVTTTVQTKRDIRDVYVRYLDPASLEPYRIVPVGWTAHDRVTAGNPQLPTVMLELDSSLTLDTAVNELWIRAATSFNSTTVVDTTTVDAVYRDWLVWEAVREFCQRKSDQGGAEAARWGRLLKRASTEVETLRDRFIPREPINIDPWH